MRICPHCGISNSDINKWCERCGFELIVEDREAVNTPKRSATVMNDTKTAGFVGSMGKTHYVSGHTSEDAGDMQKHVSGFGLIGSVGSVMYDAEVEHDNPSESGDVNGSLLGSVGKTKYSLSDAAAIKDYEHRDSKLYGRVGAVQYRDAKTSSSTARGINSTSGLMGSVGGSIYTTDYQKDADNSDKREIRESRIIGSMGRTRYTDRGATRASRVNEARSKDSSRYLNLKKQKGPWIVAICSIIAIIIVAWVTISISSQSGAATNTEADEMMSELIALSKSMQEETKTADEYYRSISTVLETIDASVASTMLSEAEAISLLHNRGFSQYPVTYHYSISGNYCGETDATAVSSERKPMFQTYYVSENGVFWIVYIINGNVFANPVLETFQEVPILISESVTITSYDNVTNRFYVSIPYEKEVKVKVVGQIDAETLNSMTAEEIIAP